MMSLEGSFFFLYISSLSYVASSSFDTSTRYFWEIHQMSFFAFLMDEKKPHFFSKASKWNLTFFFLFKARGVKFRYKKKIETP